MDVKELKNNRLELMKELENILGDFEIKNDITIQDININHFKTLISVGDKPKSTINVDIVLD